MKDCLSFPGEEEMFGTKIRGKCKKNSKIQGKCGHFY